MKIDDWRALGFVETVPGCDVYDGPGGWILELYGDGRTFLRNPSSPGMSYDGSNLGLDAVAAILLSNEFPRPDLVTDLVTSDHNRRSGS